jgi:pilus assembly protein CpaC
MMQLTQRPTAAVCGVVFLVLAGAVAARHAAAQTPAPQANAAASSTGPGSGPVAGTLQYGPQPVTHTVSKPVERIEMIVNTSRILTQEQRIPQTQVNNPDIIGLTALSANQIQIFAKKPGVTQVNIWNEKNEIHSIDVMVYGDVQELSRLLQSQFPKAALRLTPVSTGVVIQGYVDDPNVQSRIVEIAQQYYPNVINAITVGGVQQVLLQVRVLEVSRTKLQSLGIDMAAILENGSFFASGGAGLLRTGALTTAGAASTSGREVLTGRIASNGDNFFFFVEALKQNNLAKILADPNLTTVSGRPAFMNAGGEFPVIVPQSLGTVSVEYRRFGTQIDFVPIVLGNGVIRLEIRARVSEIDDSRSVTINGTQVPGLRTREADTASELRAGQTIAIAGLVQTRVESSTRGVPWLMDTPFIGSFFRRTSDQINEVELLIMVTPQLVEGLDPQDLCTLGTAPGAVTTNPNDWQLFNQGHVEVKPSPVRPPHFQQPYPIGAGGGGASGTDVGAGALPTGVLQPAPAVEEIPTPTAAPPVKPLPKTEPLQAPTPESRPKAPATTAPVETRAPPAIRPVESQLGATNENSSRPIVGPVSRGTNVPSVTAVPSGSTAQPGLIGPIGYDTIK